VASSCAALDGDGKKLNIDAQDRAALPMSSAIWECAFYRGHLASSTRLIEAILGSTASGSNIYLHTADDGRPDTNLVIRWAAPSAFTLASGATFGTTSSLRPFRCVGANYDAGTHPATVTGEWVGPLKGYKSDSADLSAAPWAAASDKCWSLGGHIPTATELAEMATQGLPAGSNAYLWTSDESVLVSGLVSSVALQTFRWSGTTEPTYVSGTDLNVSAKTASLPNRCVYYPVDGGYSGPGTACTQCKEISLAGSSGAKIWLDGVDRSPTASLQSAINACRQIGGHLASGRDLMEAVRHQLAGGSGTQIWASDFVYRFVYPSYLVHGAVAKWTGTDPNFTDLPTTYSDTSAIATAHPFRCMWTNEIR
jgi:hypothetical protein